MYRFLCPHCQTHLQADERKCGQMAMCGECKKTFTLPARPQATMAAELPNRPIDVNAVDLKPNQSRTSQGSPRSSIQERAYLLPLGILGLVVSTIITLRYWAMDTTVISQPVNILDTYHAIHNFGLMNDRLVGVIVGIGWTLASLLILGAALPARTK